MPLCILSVLTCIGLVLVSFGLSSMVSEATVLLPSLTMIRPVCVWYHWYFMAVSSLIILPSLCGHVCDWWITLSASYVFIYIWIQELLPLVSPSILSLFHHTALLVYNIAEIGWFYCVLVQTFHLFDQTSLLMKILIFFLNTLAEKGNLPQWDSNPTPCLPEEHPFNVWHVSCSATLSICINWEIFPPYPIF